MKRYCLIAIIIAVLIAGVFAARMAVAEPPPATSDITVTIPQYIGIEGLGDITINVIFSGSPATGSGSNTDDFTVEANVTTTIAVGTITQPTTPSELTGLTGNLTVLSGSNPGSKSMRLTASISGIPLDKVVGSYTGGSIQVTVTGL